MAKEKDPAFLFYPKDWLQGTSKMMPDEKGVYIDLLAHQHQDGSIPDDTKRLARMVGLSEAEFLPIWLTVRLKFRSSDGNHLVNQKLTDVVTKRSTGSRTKKISGSFAAVVRLSDAPQEIKDQIKKRFNINEFENVGDDLLNQTLTTWFNCAWESIANANTNGTITVLGLGMQGKGNWNPKPGIEMRDMELDQTKGGAVIQLFKFSKSHDLTPNELSLLWQIFKTQNFNGEKYYASSNDVYSHFINWSKTQNVTVNGKSAPKTNGSSYKTAGQDAYAERLRTQLSELSGG